MPLKQRFDYLLLAATVVQTAVGLAVLASASWLLAIERYQRPGSYFFTWQAATAVIGLGLLVLGMHLRVEVLLERRLALAGVALSWMLLAAAFLQPPVASTHRWLSLGGISVQPSVLARLAVILFAASELDLARRDGWSTGRLGRLSIVAAVTVAMVMAEPDLGSSALLLLVVAIMAFAAGVPARLLAAPAALALTSVAAAVALSPYRLARVRAYFDPDSASAASWQAQQSLLALGSGGLFGKGYGAGLQKLFFLPEPHTDFVYAITGEELGLAGVLVLTALTSVIVWRGIRIAMGLCDAQRALLALGITVAFAAQALIHMCVCLGILPPKGIPLPLVSYGKTDLIVTLASTGLLLNLSREVGP